jgi:hypothetical protein
MTAAPRTLLAAALLLTASAAAPAAGPIIIDHQDTDITALSQARITKAKDELHIAYGHTSHGSQLTGGMSGLDAFMHGRYGTPTGLYAWHDGPQAGALDLDDYFVSGDLGNPDRVTWAARTRTYLDNPANSDVNVVIWSWCGQVSTATVTDINTYLNLMSALEADYPHVTFVYMTGHLDGTGSTGNLNLRNQQIRDYCVANGKVLYDFADIESYDPDALVNYMPLRCNDNCDYDSDGNGTRDRNWALLWQAAHPGEWFTCSAAHTQALNGNRKAYAAWHLWVAVAEARTAESVQRWESIAAHGPLGNLAHELTDGAVETRCGGPRKIRLTFHEALDVATVLPGCVTCVGRLSGDQTPRLGSPALSPDATVLEFTLASPLPDDDTYVLAVSDWVKKADGSDLDGDLNVFLAVRACDVNDSGGVGPDDLLALRQATGTAVSAANCTLDVDCSGAITGGDLLAVRARLSP